MSPGSLKLNVFRPVRMSSIACARDRAAAGVPKRVTGVPITSAAAQRKTRSPAGLMSTIRPSWSVTMIASSANWMMAASGRR